MVGNKLDYRSPETDNVPHVSPSSVLPAKEPINWRRRLWVIGYIAMVLLMVSIAVLCLISRVFGLGWESTSR